MTRPKAERRKDFEVWQRADWEKLVGDEQPTRLFQNWPPGVRIAVLLTFDTQGDVDAAVSEYHLTTRWKGQSINYCDLTQRQYDVRRGVQRILRILDDHDIKATFPTCGATAEWYPTVIEEIAKRGHEVAAHGYRHIPLYELTDEQEFDEIERTTSSIEKVTGQRPLGWRSPMYSITERTLGYLTRLGYLYNTDFHNDDLPYLLTIDGRQIVEIPAGLDDWELYLMAGGSPVSMGGAPYASPAAVTDVLFSEFSMLYGESAHEPRIMQYCMHPKITGRPYRAKGFEDFLRKIRELPGVWFCTMEELARRCVG